MLLDFGSIINYIPKEVEERAKAVFFRGLIAKCGRFVFSLTQSVA